jgi:amino acid permease
MTPIILVPITLLVFLFFCYVAYKTTPRKSKIKPVVIEPSKEEQRDTDREDNEEQSEGDGLMTMDDPLFPPDFDDESED